MNKSSLCLAALGLLAAVPAAARTTEPAPQPQETSRQQPRADKHLCADVPPVTGSRIWKQECHTRAEWIEMGYEVKAK